jgi:hypothetical protein
MFEHLTKTLHVIKHSKNKQKTLNSKKAQESQQQFQELSLSGKSLP